jgi:hypothetical protein
MRVGVCEGSFKEGYILRTFGLEREKLNYPRVYEWLGGGQQLPFSVQKCKILA